MRSIDTGKNCLFFILTFLMSGAALSQTTFNNVSTKAVSAKGASYQLLAKNTARAMPAAPTQPLDPAVLQTSPATNNSDHPVDSAAAVENVENVENNANLEHPMDSVPTATSDAAAPVNQPSNESNATATANPTAAGLGTANPVVNAAPSRTGAKRSRHSANKIKKPVDPVQVLNFSNPTPGVALGGTNSADIGRSKPSGRSWALALNSGYPSSILDHKGSAQALKFEGRAGVVGFEASVLSKTLVSRASIDLRYRVGAGIAAYQRKTALQDEFGAPLIDHQNLFLVPIPVTLEASHTFSQGTSPLIALGVAPTLAISGSSLLQDGKVSLGAIFRVAAGVQQQFWGHNSLVLELSMNWNKILTESPSGLGLLVGYQRPL